jgi:hypothetical protein
VKDEYSHEAWVQDVAANIQHEIDQHLRLCVACLEIQDYAHMAGLQQSLDQWQARHAGFFTEATQ